MSFLFGIFQHKNLPKSIYARRYFLNITYGVTGIWVASWNNEKPALVKYSPEPIKISKSALYTKAE